MPLLNIHFIQKYKMEVVMMEYGYVRVSTREQNEQRQVVAPKEYGIAEK